MPLNIKWSFKEIFTSKDDAEREEQDGMQDENGGGRKEEKGVMVNNGDAVAKSKKRVKKQVVLYPPDFSDLVSLLRVGCDDNPFKFAFMQGIW